MQNNKKIAILGTRGIPASYGGFETFAEELGQRLAAKGYDVTVYCRTGNASFEEPFYKGVRLVYLPTLRHKYFETLVHTFLSSVHVLFTSNRIVYYCNSINSIFMILPRLFGKKVIMNVDGLEWKRAKWSGAGKKAYLLSEWLATFLATRLVTDCRRMQSYYRIKFGKDSECIAYGARGQLAGVSDAMVRRGLEPRKYCLYVSRLEPENNAHLFVEAYEKVKTDMPLVIVGHAPYAQPYIQKIRSTRDPRILFIGSVYGDEYRALLSHAFLYFHGNEVGGTNPALLEAMATGNCVVANGVGFNREVVGDAGVWFKRGNVADLVKKIEHLMAFPEEAEKFRSLAAARMKQFYDWDGITDQYDRFFGRLTRKQ